MKILKISGRNLASLEGGFEINFETEPLRSAGIFAITGPTGAGKSTILDALCLALFDRTPRLDEAENGSLRIQDVNDHTIKQNDPRSILRRGTSEGCAEVEFLSLGGERFRSHWSVRRARNSVRGNLHSQEMRLINLTTGHEISTSGKKELLDKITELIGLTFKQFTRVVLLAQGAFADFLKASENERAGLLEKLTGTEIYSEISMRIYQQTDLARRDYDAMNEKIAGIVILNDEQTTAMEHESENLAADLKHHETDKTAAQQKLRWIAEKTRIEQRLAEAKAVVAQAQQACDAAEPRRERLAQIDKAQEIRDEFQHLRTAQKQMATKNADRQRLDTESAANAIRRQAAQAEQAQAAQILVNIEKEAESIKPDIEKAGRIDTAIEVAQAKAKNAKTELAAAEKAKRDAEQALSNLNASIADEKRSMNAAKDWIEQRMSFMHIAQSKDYLIDKINLYKFNAKNAAINRALQANNEVQQAADSEHLAQLQREADELDKLLPAEIARLRAALIDGQPCPVCGSIHHHLPNAAATAASMQEDKLNHAKKSVTDKIEKLAAAIQERELEIARLKTLAAQCAELAENARGLLEQQFVAIPNWRSAVDNNKLQERITRLAADWESNNAAVTAAESIIAARQAQAETVEQQAEAAKKMLSDKVLRDAEARKELSDWQRERTNYFGGRKINEVTAELEIRRKQAEQSSKASDRAVQRLQEQQSAIRGNLAQLAADIAALQEQCRTEQEAVAGWCALHDNVSEQQLEEWLHTTPQQIADERRQLADLHNALQQAQATCVERQKNLEAHLQSAEQSVEANETTASLEAAVASLSQSIEAKNKRTAEIMFTLQNDANNRQLLNKYQEELSNRQRLLESWAKLNELFGSASGDKFKKIAQQYTLNDLLAYANRHLENIARRYRLERTSYDSLALQVVDLDMFNTVRTVHSLSGGESFLVSLALALGLSSLSSHRMSIESLFIDEGFGSLDAATLVTAMEALEHLQMQGRKIGVISHVDEMNQRIPVRIKVEKSAGGQSRVHVSQYLQ